MHTRNLSILMYTSEKVKVKSMTKNEENTFLFWQTRLATVISCMAYLKDDSTPIFVRIINASSLTSTSSSSHLEYLKL